MNMSNSSPIDQVPERVERCEDDPARTEEIPRGLKDPVSPKKEKGAGTEMAAADALTSLVDSPKKDDSGSGDEKPAPEDTFVLPEIYTRNGRKKAIPFPLKLMRVLASKEYTDVITWLPDGKSFTIINPKAFTNEVLPAHFKTAKYSSFTRKLHRWGFQRHLRGSSAGAFFHKYFMRNRVDLVRKMTCHKPKSSAGGAGQASPGDSPSMGAAMPQPLSLSQLAQPEERSLFQGGVPQGSAELNDAIELEVARRLRERIAAASLSRQALAAYQQQPMMDPLAMQLNAAAFNQNQLGGMNPMLGQAAGMGGLNSGFGANPARFGGGGMSAVAAMREAQQQQALLMGLSPQQAQGLDLLKNMNNNNDGSA